MRWPSAVRSALDALLVATGIVIGPSLHIGPENGELSFALQSQLLSVRQSIRHNLVDVSEVDNVMAALATYAPGADESEIKSWRAAQQKILDRSRIVCEWRDSMEQSRLYDRRFFNSFLKQFHADDSFYTGLVYIPIPWHAILEDAPRNDANPSTEGVRLAYEVLLDLDPRYKYFTVMVQAHVGEFEVQPERHPEIKFSRPVRWENILVFDSRGRDSKALRAPRVPIPLLRFEDWPYKPLAKRKEVFFAGSCHGDEAIRLQLGPGKAVPPGDLPEGQYEWSIFNCDRQIPSEEFKDRLYRATWAITPPGTFPASFMMYEALQAGTLPIVPYTGLYHNSSKTAAVHFPYRDIGLRWQHNLAEVISAGEMELLKRRIEDIPAAEVASRQAALRKMSSLFRGEGLTAYIFYMARLTSQADSLLRELRAEFTLGHAVELVNVDAIGRQGRV